MFSTFPYSEQPQVNPPPNEGPFVSVPGGILGLLGVSAGSSTLEANRAYDEIGAQFSWVQSAVQPNFLPHEASLCATDFYNYIQPHGAGGHFTIPSFPRSHRKRTIVHRARPACPNCNKDFGRVQELKRHLKEKHMARRRCLFCSFRWTRADGIKAHVMARHSAMFPTEMLEEIKAMRGQRFIEFMDAYDQGLNMGPGGDTDTSVSGSSSPAPLPALRPFHHTPDTTGVFW